MESPSTPPEFPAESRAESPAYVDPLIGEIIADRYLITRVIGTGGMGRVYEARHQGVRTKVAVKVLHPHLLDTRAVVDRFVSEARTAGSLGHPRIVRFLDAGRTESGLPFLVMDYLEGHTLSAELREVGALSVERAIEIAVQVASALDAAHRNGVVHRDVKPGNIFLVAGSDPGVDVRLLDFGIAKATDATTGMTQTGSVFGSAHYTAPEQMKDASRVDARADVYSLGIVTYEMLKGERAFKERDILALAAELASTTGAVLPRIDTVRRDVRAHVAVAIDRAVRRDPGQRFISAEAFARALTAPGSFDDAPTTLSGGVVRPSRRWIAGALVLGVCVLGALGWWWVGADHGSVSVPADTNETAPTTASPTAAPTTAPTPVMEPSPEAPAPEPVVEQPAPADTKPKVRTVRRRTTSRASSNRASTKTTSEERGVSLEDGVPIFRSRD
ncbi:MAG: serine/threonine-protein kinase [Polyangiales bacterium]|nr:serine/threonine protein kinase [Myxococcales bacterium]